MREPEVCNLHRTNDILKVATNNVIPEVNMITKKDFGPIMIHTL